VTQLVGKKNRSWHQHRSNRPRIW